MARKTNGDDNGEKSGKPEGLDDGRILIKKYPNRRLYNSATSKYIVLDDVVRLVKDDADFVIIDAKSGEDITREILNQIIFEQETKPGNYHFPLEFQKQLIAMYDDAYGAMVPNYLAKSMDYFVSERGRMADAMGDVVGRNTRMMMEFSQNLARQNMELFRRSWEMFGGMGASASSSSKKPSQSGTEKARDDELSDIQSKIDALQERLKDLK